MSFRRGQDYEQVLTVDLAAAVRRQLAKEAEIMASIADGTYKGAYAK